MNNINNITGYRTKEKIYESQKSLVLRVEKLSDGTSAIIKLMNSEYPNEEEIQEFLYPYELMKDIKIEGVPEMFDSIDVGNRKGIVFEDNDAMSLRKLELSTFTLEEKLLIFLNAAKIIDRIHKNNIIHKDINPSNIIYNLKTGFVGIIDFENATQLSEEKATADIPLLVGTLDYISPEQTGRMNRNIDYRADYYSLGATFYEIFSGKKMFGETTDSIELIHFHVAKEPEFISDINNKIPKPLSKIIKKLISKNSEDRYQSSAGLIVDIERCIEKIRQNGEIDDFTIGLKDSLGQFAIPQKIYGREREIAQMKKAYSKACNEGFELVLISGKEGSGKTIFAQEIQRYVTEQRGFYTAGKFNKQRFTSDKILDGLLKSVLMENDETVNHFREKIKKAVGTKGKILFEMIPSLKYLIGEQEEVEDLPSVETKNRLLFTLIEFLKVFTSNKKPLAVLIDDAQWANEAAIELMKGVLQSVDMRNIIIIMSYNEDELKSSKYLTAFFKDVENFSKANITKIQMKDLKQEDVEEIIGEITQDSEKLKKEVSKEVIRATGGHPFLVVDFILALNKKKLLYFDIVKMKWEWNEKETKKIVYEKSEEKIIAERVSMCSDNGYKILETASIIGEYFDLEKLSYFNENNKILINDGIWELLRERFIESINNSYRFMDNGTINAKFKFSNQRIYQTVYNKILPEKRAEMHYRLGEKMVEKYENNKDDNILYDIVYNLNFGKNLVKDQNDRKKISEYNFRAGVRARKASMVNNALEYFQYALNFLDGEIKNADNELLLGLTEMAYSCSNYDLMDTYYEKALEKGLDRNIKARFFEIQVYSQLSRGNPKKAVEISVEFLKELGIKLPDKVTQVEILKNLLKTKAIMWGKKISKFPEMPLLKDQRLLAITRIQNSAIVSAYLAAPELMMIIAMKQIEISIRYGNFPQSTFAYCTYGIILCGVLGELETGYEMGKAAIKLLEKFETKEYAGRTVVIAHLFTSHWKEPLGEIDKKFEEGYRLSSEVGDIEFASWALLCRDFHAFFAGKPLKKLMIDLEKSTLKIKEELKQESQYYTSHSFMTIVEFLTTTEEEKLIYSEKEEEFRVKFEKENYKNGLYYIYFNSMLKNLIMGEFGKAREDGIVAEKYIESVVSTVNYPVFYFYNSLSILLSSTIVSKSDKKRLDTAKKKLKKWSDFGPSNHLYKYLLIEAIEKEKKNKSEMNSKLFDEIAALALKGGFIQDGAIVNEIAAFIANEKGYHSLFRTYIYDAYTLYGKWGSVRKTNKMIEENAFLGEKVSYSKTSKTGTLRKGVDLFFDSSSLIKISQILSSEIKKEKLIQNMINILMENAGADKGFYISKHADEFFVEGEFDLNNKEVKIDLDKKYSQYMGKFSKPIINYVARTGESIVFSNALDDGKDFIDSYLLENDVKSILSIPVIAQNKIVGVLYFENNLTIGAFTVERLNILKIIASQAAISLENIRMYNNLEEKVAERTAELKKANEKLAEQKIEAEMAREIADESRKIKSEFLANMSHEIRTPMNGVLGLTYLMKNTELNDRQKEFMDKIEFSAKNLLGIINDILDFSKLEAGKVRLEKTDFVIEDILHGVTNLINKDCEDKGIELVHYIDPRIPKKINGDSLRLQQILLNLAGNAVKFTQEGEVVVRIDLIQDKEKSVVLRFAVRDTGIGMSQEQQNRLFKSFTQADGSISRRYGGTGLGLAISKSLVALMNGNIGVVSAENMGSTFYFDIELEVGEKEDKSISKNIQINFDGLKTLVVDDCDTSREVLFEYMKSFGCEVDTVSSGYDAIKKLKEQKYKLLLVDWKMPELDGISTVEKIRLDKTIEEFPIIIMVSSFNIEDIKSEGEKLKIDGYLTKPVQQSSLFNSIVKSLKTIRPEKENVESTGLNTMKELKGKVLVVEDNEVNQMVAQEILESFGLEIEIVEDGEESLIRTACNEYNLILMDIQMPRLDGYETTKMLRTKGVNTPIVAMTAHAMKGDRERCIEAGMQDYISKPIEIKSFYDILKKWLG